MQRCEKRRRASIRFSRSLRTLLQQVRTGRPSVRTMSRKASDPPADGEAHHSKKPRVDMAPILRKLSEEVLNVVGPHLAKMAEKETTAFDLGGISAYDVAEYKKAMKTADSFDCRIPMSWFSVAHQQTQSGGERSTVFPQTRPVKSHLPPPLFPGLTYQVRGDPLRAPGRTARLGRRHARVHELLRGR